ncbi:MAG: site-specific DNA-methyltransferase [bacterium]|nr:site-specific DNA-methyltransferase [bacterium]
MNEPESFCTLNWLGKEQAQANASSPADKVMEEIGALSRDAQTTKNLFIEGDNLDSLKLLLPEYRNKIDLAYIDPPYNTGHRFAYKDTFRSKRAPAATQHANWCNMMYPRLHLAFELLSPTGALFISLDDRELGQLRLICDEICGEDNFIAQIIWETKREAKGIPPRSMCIINHEYVIVYAKSRQFSFKGEMRQASDGFRNPDNDPRGPWKRQYLQRFGQGFPQRELRNPDNGMVFRFETPYTEEKMQAWLADGVIIFPPSANRFPARKEYFGHYKNPYKPVLSSWGLYSTKTNSEKLKAMFGQRKCFDYPKPTDLMQRLVEQACPANGIVLDLFAGSGTLAHAVMKQNAADGGQRSCISLQTAEELAADAHARRLGYTNICEVCIARLNKAADAIAAGRIDSDPADIDLGFRYYRLKEEQKSE